MIKFNGSLALTELLGGGETEFGVVIVECLRGSMAIVKRRGMGEAKPCQRQGVYTMRPRRRHSAEIRILTPTGIISGFYDTAWFLYLGSKTQIYVQCPVRMDETESDATAIRRQQSSTRSVKQ